jgi:hypothetical protein
LRILSF